MSLIISSAVYSATADSTVDYSDLQVGDVISFPVAEVKPLQFAAGYIQIQFRMLKIKNRAQQGDLGQYKLKHMGEVVVAPGGKTLRLRDAHHFTRALYELSLSSDDRRYLTANAQVIWNCHDCTQSQFRRLAREKNWFYPNDEQGVTRPFSELPAHIGELTNDPYRSLSWFVKRAGGYRVMKNYPFQEFVWAEYFRKRIPFEMDSAMNVSAGVMLGMAWARHHEAKNLPGYLGEQILDFGDCARVFETLSEEFDFDTELPPISGLSSIRP